MSLVKRGLKETNEKWKCRVCRVLFAVFERAEGVLERRRGVQSEVEVVHGVFREQFQNSVAAVGLGQVRHGVAPDVHFVAREALTQQEAHYHRVVAAHGPEQHLQLDSPRSD
jgi:hypothetical protein